MTTFVIHLGISSNAMQRPSYLLNFQNTNETPSFTLLPVSLSYTFAETALPHCGFEVNKAQHVCLSKACRYSERSIRIQSTNLSLF